MDSTTFHTTRNRDCCDAGGPSFAGCKKVAKMLELGYIILRLVSVPSFSEIMAQATKGQPGFMRDLASALWDHERYDEVLDACTLILCSAPDDLLAQLLFVRALVAKGFLEQALERLLLMRQRGTDSEQVIAEIQAHLVAAVTFHSTCLASGEFDRALRICDLLAQLCPGVLLFQKARVEAREMLHRRAATDSVRLRWEHFCAIEELASVYHQQADFAAELRCRLDVFQNSLDGARHSTLRIRNIAAALSCLLSVNVDVFDSERLGWARQLLAAIRDVPVTQATSENPDYGAPACWERFQRQLLGTIDLDAVFGRPHELPASLPMSFFSSAGVPMDLPAIAMHSRELGVRAIFATSSSAEYFDEYAQTYISSILRSCDCSFMIFICLCIPNIQVIKIVSRLGIDDPRLIYCCDDFDPHVRPVEISSAEYQKPSTTPGPYYASSALLHMDQLLDLGLPVLASGIDTVLQRGVVDLIERFSHADVVFNKAGPHFSLGCQLVNNLVLTYPTANGFLFARFLNSYLGGHLAEIVQPSFLDQLDLHMARNYVVHNGKSHVIEYFDELDINVVMFDQLNYRSHLERMRSYRFLNMFVGGPGVAQLTAEDVAMEVSPHHTWYAQRRLPAVELEVDEGGEEGGSACGRPHFDQNPPVSVSVADNLSPSFDDVVATDTEFLGL